MLKTPAMVVARMMEMRMGSILAPLVRVVRSASRALYRPARFSMQLYAAPRAAHRARARKPTMPAPPWRPHTSGANADVARPGEAARDIGDVFVHANDVGNVSRTGTAFPYS